MIEIGPNLLELIKYIVGCGAAVIGLYLVLQKGLW